MINVDLLKHWQNWLIVGFVLFLVSFVLISCKKTKVKED